MITSNDILVDFWDTIETMVSDHLVREGIHYRVEELSSVRLTVGRNDEQKLFDKPKKVLFIRMKNVQQLYSKFKKQTGTNPIDITSLISYVKNKDYYIGSCNSHQFYTEKQMQDGTKVQKAIKTSCYLFDLDLIGIGGLESETNYVDPAVAGDEKANEHSHSMDQVKDNDLPF